ncbi:SHOCT domain-containing protein [Geochorda subterranea]|uniref:SHOCT domain-containing protein n=1 Tax=Geochorda subterranea TaxID=3109564 RepID=A0ABZ1BS77_9FIRM|nr:SHOCT domain-containing protein [Limnochorda sp. LNt]WRP15662.1 SHOCT domain-containing protein [Limnochorda sp. LNt]
MMLVFWALVIGGIVWLVRVVTAGGTGATEHSRAKAIPEERFARGEISEEEFRRMRKELQ